MINRFLFLLLTCLVAQTSFASGAHQASKKLDSLLVYGQGFMFAVKEPTGWRGDIKNADEYSANIIFYPASQSFEGAKTIIRVRIDEKTDEHIEKDLAYDMNSYRAKYPKVVFKKLVVSHPTYRVVSSIFTVPGSFYEYVAYVNPGPGYKLMFSVAMNKQKHEASKGDLNAYRKIIASLRML